MDKKSKKTNVPALIACIIFFMGFFVLQRIITKNPQLTGFNGVIAQFHVMISIILVLTSRKTGFIAGIVLNAINLVMAVMAVVMSGQKQALPSIAISICTVIIIAIIYSYTNKNDTMHDELMEKYEQEIENKRVLQEKDEVLSYLAYYDRLTQMPNRHLFMENLEENISQNKQCAVVCINLDDFRNINNTYGLSTGDELIKAYAERIEGLVSDNEFSARISGDEFGIILGEGHTNQDVVNFAKKIQGIFNTPVNVDKNSLYVSASVGVAMFPRDASSAEELLRCSEKAMFMSKNNGKNKVCFYSHVV